MARRLSLDCKSASHKPLTCVADPAERGADRVRVHRRGAADDEGQQATHHPRVRPRRVRLLSSFDPQDPVGLISQHLDPQDFECRNSQNANLLILELEMDLKLASLEMPK